MGDVIELRPTKRALTVDDFVDAESASDGTHVVFEDPEDGNQHVYPLAYFEDWANDVEELIAPPEFVLKQITREWLELLRERG